MALKITKASEPMEVKNIIICLYAPPGVGKTSTAFTAKNPLLIDFDKGAYRSQYRKDTVEIEQWSDIESLTSSDLSAYDTIVIDTAGRALDFLQEHLIRHNPKLKGASGQLTLQGFGSLKSSYLNFMKDIKLLGKDIILLAHMDEQRNGDETIERLDVQGGSKNEIYKSADVMGRIRVTENNIRVLDFNPSSTGFGKNPAQLDLIKVPHFSEQPNFLADVINQIKSKLNEKSIELKSKEAKLQELRDDLNCLGSAEEFNHVLDAMTKAPAIEKKILLSAAESKGFVFNKKTKLFEAKESVEEVA